MPVIEFRGVTFSIQSRPILYELSFTLQPGESLAIVGRSGAGKSTILRLIDRLLLPGTGAVLVEGRDTREWDPYQLRRRTGYVLQEIGLFPHLTVAGNVGIVPRLLGWDPPRIAARVSQLLALAGLPGNDMGTRWPSELSGGQRQRVGVARALAADPPVLLMDEPFGALDPFTRRELRTEFRRIQRQLRKSVVLVTHDMNEATEMGDRVGVMEEGRLIALDTPAAIQASSDPHVRRLLGRNADAG